MKIELQEGVAMDWREEVLKQQLLEDNIRIEDTCELDRYNTHVSEKVLSTLLQLACYGQNLAGIMLGRRMIAEIPRSWLKLYFLNFVKSGFEYSDDWNYRRLLELVVDLIPELKTEVLSLNLKTADPNLLEVIRDYNEVP